MNWYSVARDAIEIVGVAVVFFAASYHVRPR